MFNTIHTIFALWLSQMPINIWFVFLIAFLSHWILDMIPHYALSKKGFFTRAVIDVLISLVLVFLYLIINKEVNIFFILMVVFFATLPDLFYIPDNLFKKRYFKKVFFSFHKNIQHEFKQAWIIELIVFIILFYLVFINT